MSIVVPTAASLLIFGVLEAIVVADWAQQSSDYKTWNCNIIVHAGSYRHQTFRNKGHFSTNAEISVYLQYQLLDMLLKCLWLQLTEDIDQDFVHFQQDGAASSVT